MVSFGSRVDFVRRAVRRAPLCALALTLGTLSARTAGASPAAMPNDFLTRDSSELLRRLDDLEVAKRIRARRNARSGTTSPRPPSPGNTLDVLNRALDVRYDPVTGTVNGSIEVLAAAGPAGLRSMTFMFDAGLTPSNATVDGASVPMTPEASDGRVFAEVNLPAPLARGGQVRLAVQFSGTPACAKGGPCSRSAAFSHFTTGSVFPYMFSDTDDGLTIDGTKTDLTLRVPTGNQVAVSANLVGTRSEGGDTVTTWNVPDPVQHAFGFYAFVGTLERMPVTRSLPTEILSAADGSGNNTKLLAFSPGALDFVQSFAGIELPFKELRLVRLPRALQDPGTVSYGMTLLNDVYGDYGDKIYEETWVHENAHLMWAIALPELEASQTRMFTEGLATLTEIEFSKKHFKDETRDDYLARRFHNIRMTYVKRGAPLEALPAVFARIGTTGRLASTDYAKYAAWAYEKSSATWDHIRATIGDEVFEQALHKYAAEHKWQGLPMADFQKLLESTAGVSLAPLFARWVNATARPKVRVSFTQEPGAAAKLLVSKDDDAPMLLSFLVRTEKGERRVYVKAEGRESEITTDVTDAVWSARPNPRLGILAELQSQTSGDVNFDAATDGLDLLRCARSVGQTFQAAAGGPGLWDLETRFPVECDLDQDGTVSEAEFEQIAQGFGGGR